MQEALNQSSQEILRNSYGRQSTQIKKFKDGKAYFVSDQKYNPYLIPPDWKLAEIHAQANRVSTINKELQDVEVCPCCEYQVERQDINLLEDQISLSFLGSGYPLYFHFLKYCIIILAIITLTSGEYNILSNYFGENCNSTLKQAQQDLLDNRSHACVNDWISRFTLANKQHQVTFSRIQDVLNSTTIVILMVLLLIFRKDQKEIDIICDEKEVTPSDYTIFLKKIPKNKNWDYQEKIRQYFENLHLLPEHKDKNLTPLVVTEINLVYKVDSLQELFDQEKQIINEKRKALSKFTPLSEGYIKIAYEYDQKLENLQDTIQEREKTIYSGGQYFGGAAFVSFQTEDMKQEVLQSAKLTLMKEILQATFFQQTENAKEMNFYDNEVIQVSQAPEPLDIIWENLVHEHKYKMVRRAISSFVTILLMVGCAVAIYYLVAIQAAVQKELVEQQLSEMQNNIAQNTTDIHNLLNQNNSTQIHQENIQHLHNLQQKYIIDNQLQYNIQQTNPHTGNHNFNNTSPETQGQTDNSEDSLLFKLKRQSANMVLSMIIVIINAVLIVQICRYLVQNESYNTYTQYDINLSQKLTLALFVNSAVITCIINIYVTKNVFGPGGLIYTIFYFFVLNALSAPMANFCDSDLFLKYILKWWYKRKGSACLLTQKEANEICEYPRHEIEICYADIMKTMYVTIFYSTVVPFGQIITLLGLVLYYWVEKYVVLRRKTIKKTISVHLSIEMTEYLEFIIPIYCLSSVLFKWQLGLYLPIQSIVCSVIGCIYILFPIQLFVDKFFLFEEQDETLDYHEANEHCFQTNYTLQNPVTKRDAQKSQFQILKNNNNMAQLQKPKTKAQKVKDLINQQNQMGVGSPLNKSQVSVQQNQISANNTQRNTFTNQNQLVQQQQYNSSNQQQQQQENQRFSLHYTNE